MVPASEFGPTYSQQKLGLFSRTTNTMLGLIQYPQGLGLFSHTTIMWQISNLQIDSSVIQIVQSDVLRNSIDTTATITNNKDTAELMLCLSAWRCLLLLTL